jgi:hypothetical protein
VRIPLNYQFFGANYQDSARNNAPTYSRMTIEEEARMFGTHKLTMLFAVIPMALVGCAMSTGIMPAGPDTYMLGEHYAPIRGGSVTAQQATLTEANAFCVQQGKVFLPSEMQTPASLNPYGPTDFRLAFRCVPPDHPDIANYRLQSSPNFIVEQRNR